jgi:hypothetical protein
MEPFYQLQRPEGALAEHSLCLDYMTSLCVTTPFKALYRGHFFVFCSSLIYLLVLLLAPLSAETLFISLSGHCEADSLGPCYAIRGIYPLLGRIVEGILSFIAALVLLLIFNFSRHSGVYAEPLSIAGLATLFRNTATLDDFRAIDCQASNSALKSALTGKRYKLLMSTGADQVPSYGIVPISRKTSFDPKRHGREEKV